MENLGFVQWTERLTGSSRVIKTQHYDWYISKLLYFGNKYIALTSGAKTAETPYLGQRFVSC